MKKLFTVVAGLLFLAGCSSVPTLPKTDFLGEYAKKMEPGPEGGAKYRWVNPDADFNKYKKVMVDYVVFSLAPDSDYKYIEGEEMKNLGDAASLALVIAIKEKYPIVAEPGPDVVRLRMAIVGLKQSSPALSTVTTVVPVGLGLSLIKKGASGTWTGAGATQAEAMALDSMTGEVLGVMYDEYSAGFSERFTKWGSVEEAFTYWAQRGVKSIEVLKAQTRQHQK